MLKYGVAVGVAQRLELLSVEQEVVGSNPITHPEKLPIEKFHEILEPRRKQLTLL